MTSEAFYLLAFSLSAGILFSRTFLALLENWREEAVSKRHSRRRKGD